VFVIDVRSAGSGADAGCGTPGQLVTIVFLEGSQPIGTLVTPWDSDRVHELLSGLHTLYLPLIGRN
jgi:hypothetical protein